MSNNHYQTNIPKWETNTTNMLHIEDLNLPITKELIVTRLLSNNFITISEAVVLLKETIVIEKKVFDNFSFDDSVKLQSIENCPCNIKNGGNGICNCCLNNIYTISNINNENNK